MIIFSSSNDKRRNVHTRTNGFSFKNTPSVATSSENTYMLPDIKINLLSIFPTSGPICPYKNIIPCRLLQNSVHLPGNIMPEKPVKLHVR